MENKTVIEELTKIRKDLLTSLNNKDILAAKFEINNIDTLIYKLNNSNQNIGIEFQKDLIEKINKK